MSFENRSISIPHWFYSNRVQTQILHQGSYGISIPHWFYSNPRSHLELPHTAAFQYHTGSIQTDIMKGEGTGLTSNFNTTLVLFKLAIANIYQLYNILFQYHTGSIQTDSNSFFKIPFPVFQYHTGSIQTINVVKFENEK